MPTKGNPRHGFRLDAEEWQTFLDAVKRDPDKRDASGVLRDFVYWYNRRRKASAPKRPASSQRSFMPARSRPDAQPPT